MTAWLTRRELDAWKSLALMQLQLTAELNRGLTQHGLSFQDYVVLATLADEPTGRRRLHEISAELGWETSRASHHITRMSDRGLVRKEKCPTDQRGLDVCLTPEGRQASTLAAPTHVAQVRALFVDALSVEQLDTIRDVAHAVLERLAAETDTK